MLIRSASRPAGLLGQLRGQAVLLLGRRRGQPELLAELLSMAEFESATDTRAGAVERGSPGLAR
ncbi:hypothetical protein [Streptomyces sp. NPDC051684]|uniref:hypothetical protein n=1 Tax=Streptomyces sp. NPDC051684 TaxID=3365670 RepID=UPI00378EEDF7